MSEALLKKLYYDTKTGLTGVEKLYRKAIETDSSISRSDVKKFIQKQKLSQVFATPRKSKVNFQITGGLGHYQSDLTFFEQYKRQNSNYSIILTLINVNSKVAYALALKDKSGATMQEALKKLIDQIRTDGREIHVIQSDLGTEYQNKHVRDYLEKEGIQQTFCQQSTVKENEKKCLGVAERFNRTLKALLNRYMELHNTARWLDGLEDALKNYNESFHSTIKMKPIKVDKGKEIEIIAAKQANNAAETQKLKKQAFQAGDQVRLPVKKKQFDKEGKNFTDEVFIVDKVNSKTIRVKGQDTLYPIDKVLRIMEVQTAILPEAVRRAYGSAVQAAKTVKPVNKIKEAKKEAKVVRILKKEGVDESNIREPRLRARKPVNYKV